MQKPLLPLRVNVSATFTAEPVEPSLTWWLEHLGWSPKIEFAPYNQVFQQLLDPSSAFGRQRDGVNVVLARVEDWLRRSAPPSAPVHQASDDATFVLPNGLEISQLNRYETEYVYQEIFSDRVYLRHGITIANEDTVIDIGANIGLFSLFVAEQAPGARVFACEPSPMAFAVLQKNLSRHAPRATPLHCGVGDVNRRMSFTAYDRSSVFSSFHADADADRDAIRAVVRNVLREQAGVGAEALESLTDTLVADRLEARVVEVEMRTLSAIIGEQGIDRIDLLKIDAEKSELDILRGIEIEHWPRIRQIVLEVHDTTGTVLPEVRAILETHQFDVTAVEEESLLGGSGLFNVYAIQRGAARKVKDVTTRDDADLRKAASEFAEALRASSARTAVPHIVVFCPPSLISQKDPEWLRLCREVEAQTAGDLAEARGVHWVTSAALEKVYPEAASHDARADSLGRIPYTPLGFAALGAQTARRIYAALRPAAKVIVVDCDQTLWEGVVGEDSAAGLRLGPSHVALQRFLVEQQALGRLICLCSKNDESDVLSAFRSRPDFPLTLDHLTTWRINWERKSTNLRTIAEELDLGLDSFVFIDDNPAECAEVRSVCPEVVTVQLPSSAPLVGRLLSHLWPCDARHVTEEDQQRTTMYRQGAERSRFREQAISFEAFIAGLDLEVLVEPLSAASLARAAQLTERTNQFNFTTIRRSENQLSALQAAGDLEFLTVRVADRFGDYGLVGLVGFGAVEGRLRVDTFLLSCRVLGKGVEHRVVAELGSEALRRNLASVDLAFVATKRNAPALQFAESIDHCTRVATADPVVFRLDAAAAASVRFDPSRSQGEDRPSGDPPIAAVAPLLTDPGFLAHIHDSWAEADAVLGELSRRNEMARVVASPRTATEETLVRIWRECLGQTPGIDENYFDLGGDSIRAVQIASRAQSEGLQISPKQVLDCQTITALAASIGEAKAVTSPGQTATVAVDSSVRQQLLERFPALIKAYPLTPMQLMFYAQYSAGLDVGFEQWQFTIEGTVSVPGYRRAWEQVIAQHDALRTAFWSKGLVEPHQVVLPTAALAWHEESLEGWSSKEQSRRIEDFVATDRGKRFSLAQAPLTRVAVFALGRGRWRVVWTFHHLVIDGWSCPIVLADVAKAYTGGAGQPKDVPQFASFVRWLRAVDSRDEDYWRALLSGLRGPTPLPLGGGSSSRPARHTEWTLTMPASRSSEIVARARSLRITLGTFFQAAWAILVARMSEQDDVVFGVTMSGRAPEISGVEQIVGTFINNVPVRIRVTQSQALTSLMTAMQSRVTEVAEHQFLPPSRIQELAAVPTRDRLFDSLLIVQNYLGAGADSQWTLGRVAQLTSLEAPVRTGYPVTVVVTPGVEMRVSLVARDLPWSDDVGREVLGAFVGLATVLAEGRAQTVSDAFAAMSDVPQAGKRVVIAQHPGSLVSPRTRLEAEIAAVWEAAFGHSTFGVDSNFFELGGHSLLMVKVHEALQTRLTRALSIVDLFEHPTIAGLAQALAGETQDTRVDAARSRAHRQREAMARQRRRGGAS